MKMKILKLFRRSHSTDIFILSKKNYTFLLLYCVTFVTSKDCVGRDQCSCTFDDGTLVALNSLGNSNGTPRYKDMASSDGEKYSYNPCYPFSEGSGDCSNAAACMTSKIGQIGVIGEAQPVQFQYTDGNVVAGYTAGTGIQTITQVVLKCDESACTPNLVADGNVGINTYQLTLTTVCACPGGCTEDGPVSCSSPSSSSSGIGGGSIILIVYVTTTTFLPVLQKCV